MADATNPTNMNENTNIIPAGFDPVAWNKKGNKLVYGNVMDLRFDPLHNIRFKGGVEYLGIKPKDSYDIPSMRQGIWDGGGIQEPIWVSVRTDGNNITLRGNRRGTAGQEMVLDPTTPPELVKTLTTRTPMFLLHGLTPSQEAELVNDQTQKEFRRSEVIRHIWALRKQGWDFLRIALSQWELMGKFTRNVRKVAEIRSVNDPVLKRDLIKKWLRGTLDEYILSAYNLGPVVQKCVMLTELGTDGLLEVDSEKPYCKIDSQKRLKVLEAAKKADGSKWTGAALIEGSEFKKAMDAFRLEDYPPPGTIKEDKPKTDKMMDKKSVEGLVQTMQSRAVKSILERVLGKEVPDVQVRDDYAAMMEAKEMLVEQFLPRLKPDVAAIVRVCLVNPDPTDFVTFLESQCVAEESEAEIAQPDDGTFPIGGEADEAEAVA